LTGCLLRAATHLQSVTSIGQASSHVCSNLIWLFSLLVSRPLPSWLIIRKFATSSTAAFHKTTTINVQTTKIRYLMSETAPSQVTAANTGIPYICKLFATYSLTLTLSRFHKEMPLKQQQTFHVCYFRLETSSRKISKVGSSWLLQSRSYLVTGVRQSRVNFAALFVTVTMTVCHAPSVRRRSLTFAVCRTPFDKKSKYSR